jgi:hypothetical protein
MHLVSTVWTQTCKKKCNLFQEQNITCAEGSFSPHFMVYDYGKDKSGILAQY